MIPGYSTTVALLAGCTLAALAVPTAARAWWRGGVWIGVPPVVPYYYPPPPLYPPPVIYPPPPVYAPYSPYAAPAPQPQQGGQACYAGPYVCPLLAPAAAGAACSCPTNAGGRIAGRVG